MFKMAPFRINSLDFGNSYLNCTYSIKFLIKIKNRMISKYFRKKIPKKIFKSCFKLVFLTKKIQGEEPMLCSWNFFSMHWLRISKDTIFFDITEISRSMEPNKCVH